jgi:PAS domain S-box-containing protein
LYSDDSFLLDVLSRFIGDALADGRAAVVIATASHRSQLEKSLAARGFAPCQAAAQGRYVTLDASETLARFMINGALDEKRFLATVSGVLTRAQNTQADEDCRIAVFGEMVALLWAQGQAQEAIRVEHLWNELAEKYSFSLLCAYPVGGFNHENHLEPFLRMCGQHSSVVPSESYLGLSSEEERLRNVAQLQQRAQVLEKQLAVRHSEQQFRLLVEAVQDYAIFMLDVKGNVSSWNPGAERIKQYKGPEIIGKHFSRFYPEEEIRSGKPERELVIATKEGKFEEEGWRLRKDGSKFWASVTITAVRNESGQLVGFAKITRDFTERIQAQRALQSEVAERREAQAQLHRSEKSLRQLSLHLLRTQDEERKRIGRDLHDSLGQYLVVLKMKLESLVSAGGKKANEAATQDLEQCIRLTEDCIKEVRTMSYLLYPPMLEEMGLKSAILWYLDGFSARSGIGATFEVQAGFDRLPRESELALFRVLQESLTNVHRHSGSPTAHVRLSMKDGFGILEVEDKGKGISPQLLEQSGEDWMGALGVGLRGMNERMRQLGGRIELVSNASGTAVSAIVPAAPPPA